MYMFYLFIYYYFINSDIMFLFTLLFLLFFSLINAEWTCFQFVIYVFIHVADVAAQSGVKCILLLYVNFWIVEMETKGRSTN